MRDHREAIKRNLAVAISTMRDAVDDAERRSKDGDDRAIRAVLHALAWGMANASSSIENAMSYAEEGRA